MAEGEAAAARGAAVDRSERPSGIVWVSLLPYDWGKIASFVILASFAIVGMIAMFAWAMGIAHFGQSSIARNDLTKLIADDSPDGILVTNKDGRVIYANQ